MQEEKEKAEAEKKAKDIKTVLEYFQNMKVPDHEAISIVFRLPNSSRVEQRFNRNDLIRKMYDFISVCPASGMSAGSHEFEITQTFPRVVLDPKSKISDVFGNSDAELVNVFELG